MKLEIQLREGFSPEDYEELKKMLDTLFEDEWKKPYWYKGDGDMACHIHVVPRTAHLHDIEEIDSKYELYKKRSNDITGVITNIVTGDGAKEITEKAIKTLDTIQQAMQRKAFDMGVTDKDAD